MTIDNWTGLGSGDWNDPAQWSAGAPTGGDTVEIGPVINVTVSDTPAAAGVLNTSAGSLDITNTTLDLGAGSIEMAIELDAAATLRADSARGAAGGGVVDVGNGSTYAGTISGAGTMVFATPHDQTLEPGVVLTVATVEVSNVGGFANLILGTDVSYDNVFELLGGGGVTTIQPTVDNTGTVSVDPGTLSFALSVTNSGLMSATDDGTLLLSAGAGNSGQIHMSEGGTVEIGGTDTSSGVTAEVVIDDATGWLRLDDLAAFGSVVQGFRVGDTIELANVVANGGNFAGGTPPAAPHGRDGSGHTDHWRTWRGDIAGRVRGTPGRHDAPGLLPATGSQGVRDLLDHLARRRGDG